MVMILYTLKIDPEKGVIGCRQLPNVEIERVESGSFPTKIEGTDDEKERKIKFVWKEKSVWNLILGR